MTDNQRGRGPWDKPQPKGTGDLQPGLDAKAARGMGLGLACGILIGVAVILAVF